MESVEARLLVVISTGFMTLIQVILNAGIYYLATHTEGAVHKWWNISIVDRDLNNGAIDKAQPNPCIPVASMFFDLVP